MSNWYKYNASRDKQPPQAGEVKEKGDERITQILENNDRIEKRIQKEEEEEEKREKRKPARKGEGKKKKTISGLACG